MLRLKYNEVEEVNINVDGDEFMNCNEDTLQVMIICSILDNMSKGVIYTIKSVALKVLLLLSVTMVVAAIICMRVLNATDYLGSLVIALASLYVAKKLYNNEHNNMVRFVGAETIYILNSGFRIMTLDGVKATDDGNLLLVYKDSIFGYDKAVTEIKVNSKLSTRIYENIVLFNDEGKYKFMKLANLKKVKRIKTSNNSALDV